MIVSISLTGQYPYLSMPNNNGVLLNLYIPWEANLDPVTEEQSPSWVCLYVAFKSSSEPDVILVPSCKDAFKKRDDEEREWMMEVMYESYQRFYSESVLIVDKVSL